MTRRRLTTHATRLALVALPGMLAAACSTGAATTETRPTAAPTTVQVAAVAMRDGRETLSAGGVLRGRTSAALAARVTAQVVDVPVRAGDRVRQGQRLVQLDDRDVLAQARQADAMAGVAARQAERMRADKTGAEAALVLARATHQRIAELHQKKSATAQELDEALAGVRAAESRVATADAAVAEATAGLDAARAGGDAAGVRSSFARIVAPFDGVVTERLADPGMLATAGTPLVRVEDVSALELEVRLDESRVSWVERGATVTVTIDGVAGAAAAGARPYDGRVTEVARAAEADTRAFLVRIALPAAEGLRPGMFGRASLPGPARRALSVPDTALVRRGQLASVFVAADGVARMRLVNPGRASEGFTEILAGLSDGEMVVVAPPPALTDGAPIALETGRAPAVAAPATGGPR